MGEWDACGAGEENVRKDDDANPVGVPVSDPAANGDGLTVWEEYRGFMVNEGEPIMKGSQEVNYKPSHIRTSPTQKDIFVFAEDPKMAKPVKECYFKETKLAVHVITDKNFVSKYSEKNSPQINFTNGYACGIANRPLECRQHAIRVRVKNISNKNKGDMSGQATNSEHNPEGKPGTPRDIAVVNVGGQVVMDGMAAKPKPGKKEAFLAILAHEMSHAVGIFHHGDAQSARYGDLDLFPEGGQSSGDPNCVMKIFNVGHGWISKTGKKHMTYSDKKNRLDAPGTSYCISPRGSGVNEDQGETNDAQKGNCRGQLKVKDWPY
jgi:hypothetical protein